MKSWCTLRRMALVLLGMALLAPMVSAAGGYYVVAPGDTMYQIAERLSGDGSLYPEIIAATQAMNETDPSFARVADPGRLEVGWKLAVPKGRAQARFVGTWELVTMEFQTSDGGVVYPFGENPMGIANFDARGNFNAQVMQRDRPPFAANDQAKGTPEENQAAVAGYVAYFGTYQVFDDGTYRGQVEGSLYPNWIGGEQVRYWSFEGNHLLLKTGPIPLGGTTMIAVLEWKPRVRK